MAVRRTTAGRRGRRPVPDPAERLMTAALALAAARGWRDLSLAEIADEAGLSPMEAWQAFPTKSAILVALIAKIESAVLAGGAAAADESARDRLFDLIMRCFDGLQEHRAAVANIAWDCRADPATVLILAPRVLCSLALVLEMAGLSSVGLRGIARVNGLGLVFAQAVRTWLGDDSADMAKTMAALDLALRRAEQVARMAGDAPWRRASEEAGEA